MRAIELLIIRAAADDHLLLLGWFMAAELMLDAKNVATNLEC